MITVHAISLLLFIYFAHIAFGQEKRRDIPDKVFNVNPNVTYPKIYYYDTDGILHLNGTFPGESTPIVIDYKAYRPTCTSNVYFTFTFVTKNSTDEDPPECRKGMTVCYESQLDNEDVVLPSYRVKNVENSVAKECERLNEGNKRAHGFNLALKPPYYRLKLSYTNTIYIFKSPDTEDGIVNLQIGTPKSLMTRLFDSKGQALTIRDIKGSSDQDIPKGDEERYWNQAEISIMIPPDTENLEQYSTHAGVWTMYLDFKRSYKQMQVIQAIHSRGCEMEAIVRGNKMQRCRSWMENLAVTEPVNTEMTFVYTHETGVIQRDEQAHENLSELKTKIAEQKLQKMIDKSIEDHLTKTSSSGSSASSSSETKGKANSAAVNLYTDTNAKAGIDVGGDGTDKEKATGSFKFGGGLTTNIGKNWGGGSSNQDGKGSSGKQTNTMYNEVRKSSSLMEAFSNTMGTAQTLSQSEMMSSTSAFSSREAIDVEVTLPPNRKMMLQQLMFECDGNVIKMPRIDFTDGKVQMNLTNSTESKPRVLKLDPDLKPNKESLDKMHREGEQDKREQMEKQRKEAEQAAKNKPAIAVDNLLSSGNIVKSKLNEKDAKNNITSSVESMDEENGHEEEHNFGFVNMKELASVAMDKEKEL